MIQVRFVSYQFRRWMRATEKIKATALSEKENLPRRMSIDYVDEIRKNITIGRFSNTYAAYNERYRKWKYTIFKSTGGFWNLRGELLAALEAKNMSSTKFTSRWFAGIPAGVFDSGNVSWFGKGDKGRSLPIALYAYYLEYGRRGQPSRPLFRPTLIEYASKGAVKRLEESRKLIMLGWKRF